MNLYLARHGDAVSDVIDPARPLSEQGVAVVERVAGFLAQAGIRPQRILHSGKLRAEQTATILAGHLKPEALPEPFAGLKPNDDPTDFEPRVVFAGHDGLVVGHLPFLDRLVTWLVLHDADCALTHWAAGGVACLTDASGEWRLAWLVSPEIVA